MEASSFRHARDAVCVETPSKRPTPTIVRRGQPMDECIMQDNEHAMCASPTPQQVMMCFVLGMFSRRCGHPHPRGATTFHSTSFGSLCIQSFVLVAKGFPLQFQASLSQWRIEGMETHTYKERREAASCHIHRPADSLASKARGFLPPSPGQDRQVRRSFDVEEGSIEW